MPIEIGYTGDLITPSSGSIQPIPNLKVLVIPETGIVAIDTGQTIYLPHRAICTLVPNANLFRTRGLIVMADLYTGPGREEVGTETEHRIIVTGFNPHEYDINLVRGDPLCYLVFGQTRPVRLTRRGK